MADGKEIALKKRITNALTSEKMMEALAVVLPRHITPERIVKTALFAASRNQKIFKCSPSSVAAALLLAAELGLDCSGATGEGYLVPFWNAKTKQLEAKFIPGYQGFIELGRRSGQVLDVVAQVVYENDDFDIDFGRADTIRHRPEYRGPRGAMLCVYTLFWLRDNPRPHVEFMTKEDIHKIREASESWKNVKTREWSPWAKWESEMWRKSSVRRGFKYVPKSPEIQRLIEIDNQATPQIINAAAVLDALPDTSAENFTPDAPADEKEAPKTEKEPEASASAPEAEPESTKEPLVVEPDMADAAEEPAGPPVDENKIPWIALEKEDQEALSKAARKHGWGAQNLIKAVDNRGAVVVAGDLKATLTKID